MNRSLRRLAQRPWLSALVVGLVALVGCVAISQVAPPDPKVDDEFSYLLASDTFAQGRLTNPPHLLWVHFESLHIIQQPTYMSKFPPGQGLVLALGQVLTGQPIVGVWLSVALASLAIFWMFRQWLPARWALLGGLLVAVRLSCFGPTLGNDVLGYWGRSYWGGAVAAAGGALVFGALRQVVRQPRIGPSVILGCGLAILANTRPLEGMLASLPAGIVFLVWLLGKRGPSWRDALARVLAPLGAVLVLTALAMAFYNQQITGNPWRMPYQVHEATYGATPVFIGLPLPPPVEYRHESIRFVHEVGMRRWHQIGASPEAIVKTAWTKVVLLWSFYCLPGLSLALPGLPWVFRDRWLRLGAASVGLVFLVLLLQIRPFPHYTAPVTGMGFLFLVQGLRQVRLWRWRGRPWGRFLVRNIPLLMGCALVAFVVLERRQEQADAPQAWHHQRAELLAGLEAAGGRHLVLVHHGSPYDHQPQIVHNWANIDAAPVVWARDMGPEQNRALLDYFKDRQVWQLDADARPLRLIPRSPP